MNKRTRIQKLARFLLILVTISLGVLALGMVFTIAQAISGPKLLIADILPDFSFPEKITTPTLIVSVSLLLMMIGLAGYTMWQMRDLFARYSKGESLTVGCAEAIRKTGVGIIAITIFDIIMLPMQSVLISSSITPEDVSLVVDISAANIGLLLAGGLIVLVGWVMREAVEVAQENARFV